MAEPGGVVNARPAFGKGSAAEPIGAPRVATRPYPPAPRAVMYAYPWDLYDHGVERSLDELDACGIDAVQLSFSYHVATFFNPRNPRRKIRFGEPGVLEFDPAASLSSSWPFDPPVAPEVNGSEYLDELLAAMAGRRFDVIAWVVYLYNHNLARQHPDLSVVNAFGDRNGAQLCPANPVVQGYVDALTNAVLHTPGLSGFVTESLSFLPYDYGFLNLKSAVTPSVDLGRLLSLCFCEHCMSSAGTAFDVEGLRREVRELIEAELAELPDGENLGLGIRSWWQDSEELSDYLAVRENTASSLQREILARARAGGLRTGTNAAENQDPDITGVPNEAVVPLRTDYRFEVTPRQAPARLAIAVEQARSVAGDGAAIYALAQLSNFQTEASFAHTMETVAELGIEHFRFYEYGLLSERQLTWLRNSRELWMAVSDGRRNPYGPL